MTLTIRIANTVRRTIPITEALLERAGRLIEAELPVLRMDGPVAVTLAIGNVVHLLHKD